MISMYFLRLFSRILGKSAKQNLSPSHFNKTLVWRLIFLSRFERSTALLWSGDLSRGLFPHALRSRCHIIAAAKGGKK